MITSSSLKANVVVRITEAADIERIEQVLLDAYDEYQHVLSSEQWEEYRGNIIAAVAADQPIAKVVAEIDGQAVGAVLLYSSSVTAYGHNRVHIEYPIVRLLGVRRSARGQGVATALIEACIRLAQESRASYLYLHTSDLMREAIALYEKLGFERVPEKEFSAQTILVKCYRLPLNLAIA